MADRQWFVYHITESVLQNYRSARIIRQRSRPLDNRRVPCILYEASILAMPLLIELTIIVAAAALLCIYVGWGVTRLALPPSLMPFRAPLTPLVGYATVLWVGFILASLALNLRWTLVVLLAGATVLNILAWRAEGRPRPLTWLRAQPEALIPPLLALLTGILPLLSYGYLTIIGRGWDTESYLPMAQHLIDYPLPRIMDAPPGLLRDLVARPPQIGLTLGFSVFHGMTMLLSMSSALASFAPVIAFLRALSALAVYVWLRTTMGLGRTGSFFGALLTTLASLPLWIGYFNFGMQMSAWCLLPLALTVGLAAVDHLAQRRTAAWRAALLAAIILASIPVAYYPALVIAVPLIAATGAARLLEIWRHPQRQITPVALTLAALALAVPTFAAATLAILDYFEGFSFRYSLIEPKIGPDRFIGLEEIIGLTAFRLTTGGTQPPALLVGAAALAAVLLSVAGLIAPPRRSDSAGADDGAFRLRWALVCMAIAGALFWLRFGRPYEYGFMKGAAYTTCVLWGLAAHGIERLVERARRTDAVLASGAALLILICTGWAQALTVADHMRGPAIFTRDLVAFEPIAARLPQGAKVLLSGDETLTGPINGLLATMLYGKEIWGRVPAAYASQSSWTPGGTPDYVVLAAREAPWPLEIGGRELWRSSVVALYDLPTDVVFLPGRSEIHRNTPVNSKSPASLAIWRRAGHNRMLTPEDPLSLNLTQRTTIHLRLASLTPQRLLVHDDESTQTLAVQAGITTVEATAGSTVRMIPEAPLALISAVLRPAVSPSPLPAVALDPTQGAWSVTAERQGDHQLVITTRLANPGRYALRYEVTIVEDTFNAPRRIVRVLGAAPLEGEWRLALDLVRGASEARVNGNPTPLLEADVTAAPPNGRYFGVLTIYSGGTAVAQAPIVVMSVTDGAITTFEPVAFSVESARIGAEPLPLPAHRRALLDGTPLICDPLRIVIEQAILERHAPPPGVTPDMPLAPGERLTVQIYWRAAADYASSVVMPMMSVQLLDDEHRKWAQWDGLTGGDWRPAPVWTPGEAVRQDVPLTLDAATPPGDYRLILVVYDLATGRPLPLDGQDAAPIGWVRVR